MSTERGNTQRRPQKHQNRSAFKNDMHDKTKKTKIINSINASGVCKRCKEIIDWKIKYKKYKLLTVPKKCTKCLQKTVKHAYYVICTPCGSKLNICCKCCQKNELVGEPEASLAEQMSEQSQLEAELKQLPERKRRTFLRLKEQGQLTGNPASSPADKDFIDDDTEDFSDEENLRKEEFLDSSDNDEETEDLDKDTHFSEVTSSDSQGTSKEKLDMDKLRIG